MPTNVVMPQMGESIAEGTIVRWIKRVGDKVDRDEPLFEISTDKVDAEIPSPAAGVVSEIRVKEGETVAINSVVAVIGAAASAATASGVEQVAAERAADAGQVKPARASAPPAAASVSGGEPMADAKPQPPPRSSPQADGASPSDAAHAGDRGASEERAAAGTTATAGVSNSAARPSAPAGQPDSLEHVIRQRSSPLVRKIASEHNVDISRLQGSGIAGRVTKDDILAYIESGREQPGGPGGPGGPDGHEAHDRQTDRPKPDARAGQADGSAPPQPTGGGTPGQVVPMSVMRKRIAEHMTASRRTSAHVHSVFEVNFGRVAQVREASKAEFERSGVKLTYLSFIVKAAVDALRAVPVVNASIDGENIVHHKEINIGIAVALDWGLIVPVVKKADERNLLGLTRAIADLANRARGKQLKPDDVAGGTFTITNPGVFGALFGMPIINQPQVAILGVGNVEKRPVVIDDAIAIRPMAYLTLGYDHRLIDGAVADQFMSHVKRTLENWDLGPTT